MTKGEGFNLDKELQGARKREAKSKATTSTIQSVGSRSGGQSKPKASNEKGPSSPKPEGRFSSGTRRTRPGTTTSCSCS